MNSNSGKSIPVSNKLGGAVFMFVAALIFALATYLIFRIWEFNTQATHATGQIDSRYIDDGHTRGGASPKFQYHYAAGGDFCTTTTTVSAETFGQFHVGDSVPISFLSDHPADSRLDLPSETQRHWRNVWKCGLIGLPLFAFAAFIYRLPPNPTHG